VAAVLDDDAAVATRADRLRALRDYSIQLFGAVPLLRAVPPAGGIYLCLDASAALRDGAYGSADDHELCARLAEVAGVRLRAGSTFGLDGHLRLCVAAPREVLRAAAERLTRFFSAARRPVAASAGPVLAGGAPCQ
jgi:aspartate aminotransferase